MDEAQGTWTLPEVALVVFGALLLLWQPTFFLNDELAQALGLRTLAHGALVTNFVPLDYQGYLGSLFGQYSLHDILYGDTVLAGSWMENILALPVRSLLAGLAAPLGLGAALGLVAGAGIGTATWTVARRTLPARRAVWTGLAVGVLLAAGAPRHVAAPFLDIAALNLVTMAATALAAALWWHMLRPHGPRLAWFGTALLVAGTPMLFWALQIKYHGLALALESIAIWCYRDGARTSPLGTLAAAGVVGLAVWNHEPSGLLLGAALLLAALPAVRLPGLWARAGAGAGGLLAGMVPWWLEGWASRRALAVARAHADGTGLASSGGPPSGVPGAGYAHTVGAPGFLDTAVWNDPLGALDVLWQTYVWPDWFQVGNVLSALSWAPWILLAVTTLARRDLRARVPLWPSAVFLAIAPPLLAGVRMLDVGGGFDMRHAVIIWPWLVLLSWPALAEILARRPMRWWTGQSLAAASVGMAFLLVTNLLWHKSTGHDLVQMGYGFEGTWLHRYAGILLAAGLAGTLAAGRWLRARASRDAHDDGGDEGDAVLAPARFERARDHLVAWSLAASFSLGLWLRLVAASPGFEDLSTPFVAWPTRLVSMALRWVGYSY